MLFLSKDMALFILLVAVFCLLFKAGSISAVDCNITKDCTDCSFRDLEVVPSNLPLNISCLDMAGNRLTKFEGEIWKRYPNIEKLSIARNSIQLLDNNSFTFLSNLLKLDISLNKIRYDQISNGTFKPLKRLIYLDMKQNLEDISQTKYYPSSLSDITTLETLMIDGLAERAIPNLPSLTALYFSGQYGRCNISILKRDVLLNVRGIKHLFMSNCSLKKVENTSLEILPNVSSLDLSWNTDLGFQVLADIAAAVENNTNFKRLNLNNVYEYGVGCTQITVHDVMPVSKTSVRLLTVEGNSMTGLDEGAVYYLPKSLKYLSVRDNIMMRGKYATEVIKSGIFDHLIYYDSSEQFMSHIPELLKSLENQSELMQDEPDAVASEDCEKMLTRCEFADYFQIIDKRIKQFNITPIDWDNVQNHMFTHQIEFLDLSSNIPGTDELAMFIFRYSPHIKFLNISNNREGYFNLSKNQTFLNFSSLKYLDLSSNKIKYIHNESFTNLVKLQKLYLSRNNLRDLLFNLSGLTNLDYLDLAYNRIRILSEDARQIFDTLPALKLNLMHNRLLCTCKNTAFVSWMVKNRHKLEHLYETKCSFDNFSKVSLEYFNLNQFQIECSPPTYFILILVVSLCILTFVFAVTCGLVYRFKWNLRYLFYMTKFKLLGEYQSLENREFERDVFVSYAEEDRNFVSQLLITELENKGGFSLLLHERDFKAGVFVVDNIMHAITTSRRTLVVLSKAYITSKWCMYELNMARMEAADTGRNVLCLILMEDVPTKYLPLEVIEIIKKKTYLEFPAAELEHLSGFWDRLRATLTCYE